MEGWSGKGTSSQLTSQPQRSSRPCVTKSGYLTFFVVVVVVYFLLSQPWHIEVSSPGMEAKPQQRAGPYQILNSLHHKGTLYQGWLLSLFSVLVWFFPFFGCAHGI